LKVPQYPDQPLGRLASGRVEKSPRNWPPHLTQEGQGLRYTGYKRFTADITVRIVGSESSSEVCGPTQSCLRHPPPWMGYAGRNSETESAHPEELGKDARPPSTVMSGLLYRFTDATAGEELRQRRFSVLNFLRVRQKTKPPPSCASHPSLVVRFCAHLLRSPRAYVSSARQARPHAHSL
jgi:hypothetical protein